MTLSRSLSPEATGRLRAIQQYLKTRKNFDYKRAGSRGRKGKLLFFSCYTKLYIQPKVEVMLHLLLADVLKAAKLDGYSFE